MLSKKRKAGNLARSLRQVSFASILLFPHEILQPKLPFVFQGISLAKVIMRLNKFIEHKKYS